MNKRYKNTKLSFKFVTSLMVVLSINACAQSSPSISRSQLGSSMQISYGTVEYIEPINIRSDAPKGALVGGLLGGVVSGHRHRSKHALEGAAAGALLTGLLESKNKQAYQYTVSLQAGGETKMVTESGGINVGDCVSLEQGQTANIRRVASVYCQHHGHSAFDDPVVQSGRHEEAAACHAAKDMALQATTEQQTDIALKKVRIFCD